jgi:hypothetical protein
MSKVRSDNISNRADDGAPKLVFGAEVPVGYGITGAGGINITGIATATSFSGNISGGTVAGSTGSFTGDVDIADKIVHTDDTNTAIRFPAVDTFSVETGGSEAIRVDSSQRLLVNTATTRTNYDNGSVSSNLLHVERTAASGNAGISICANAATAADAGSILYMGRTKATSNGATTVVADNDLIARISFQGADGSELVEAASIRVDVDGTPGANDMPGRIEFHTTSDGAAGATERVRITSAGRFGFNTISPDYTVDINGELGITEGQPVTWHDGSGNAAAQIYGDSSSNLIFRTGVAGMGERMRLLPAGGLTFNGDTAAANALDDYEEGTYTPSAQNFSVSGTSTLTGQYVKVGRLVTVGIKFINTGTIAHGVSALITLPFAMASGTEANGLIGMAQNTNSASFNSNIAGTQCKLDGEGAARFFVGSFTTTGSGGNLLFGGSYIAAS